jgi:hypothetical protein
MNAVEKAIKALSKLKDAEKIEVAEYYKVEEEDEKKGEDKVAKEEEKTKDKEVKKEETKANSFDEQFKTLNEKLETTVNALGNLKEDLKKSKAFGEKAKTKGGSEENSFDDLFGSLLKNK